MAQQKAAEAAQEALTDSAKRLQFKWAEKVAPVSTVNQVKSLAQIQAEEQERIAKSKVSLVFYFILMYKKVSVFEFIF